MFITPSSGLFSLVVISSLSLSQAATVPECAANCMSIKLTEAATWFGPGDVQAYCRHPEFLVAYNKCLDDHCKGDDLTAGKLAGEKTCADVTPTPGGVPAHPDNPKNATAHPPLSGPAGTPENSNLIPSKNTTQMGSTNNMPNGGPTSTSNGTTNTNGALSTSTNLLNSTANGAANATNRFSGAVGSAAANASSQAGASSSFSTSSTIMITAFSSCLMSLVV